MRNWASRGQFSPRFQRLRSSNNRPIRFFALCAIAPLCVACVQDHSLALASLGSTTETIFDCRVAILPALLEVPLVPRRDRPDQSRRVTANGAGLYVEVRGSGAPIVLVHGGPGATHHYFHPAFDRLESVATIIYYDQRGTGLSEWDRGKGYSLDQAAEDLDALREQLGYASWTILGHSYGGAVAQLYATKFPDRVAALILSNSSLALGDRLWASRQFDFMSPQERARRDEIYGLTSRLLATTGTEGPEALAKKVFNAFLNGDWKRQQFYKPTERRAAEIALYEWRHDSEYQPILAKQESELDLEGAFVGAPFKTLIMASKWDLAFDAQSIGNLLGNHPGAEIETFTRSGHFPFRDEPDSYFALLRAFMSKVSPPRRDAVRMWQRHLDEWRGLQEQRRRRSNAFENLRKRSGVAAAIEANRANSVATNGIAILPERLVDRAGYEMLSAGRIKDAVALFAFNAARRPMSWAARDSLGDGLAAAGDHAGAASAYIASLKLNPDNRHAYRELIKMGAKVPSEAHFPSCLPAR